LRKRTLSASLSTYRKKRKFTRTPEPSGKKSSTGPHTIFVVQKHDASHLHYDVRLQMEGILRSWAVPKGPPTKIGDKRLAVPTEDHPLEYAHFSGTIPEGEYGAGTVQIWDHGTYHSIKKKDGKLLSPAQAYHEGHLEVWFDGKRLKGPYALIKTHLRDDKDWLFIKMKRRAGME